MEKMISSDQLYHTHDQSHENDNMEDNACRTNTEGIVEAIVCSFLYAMQNPVCTYGLFVTFNPGS